MPWYNGTFPPSYKKQPVKIREKAVEIANALLEEGIPEGIAIAIGLKRARLHLKKQSLATKGKGLTSTSRKQARSSGRRKSSQP